MFHKLYSQEFKLEQDLTIKDLFSIISKVRKNKFLSLSLTVDEWIFILESLSKINSIIESISKKIIAFSIIFLFVFCYACWVNTNQESEAACYVASISFICCVLGLWLAFFYFKSFYDNDVLERFILPLLKLLKLDVDLTKDVNLSFDLNKVDSFVNQMGRSNCVSDQTVIYNYRQSILDLNFIFCDGCKFKLSIVDFCKKRSTKKRNLRNTRDKIKVKYKVKRMISLRVKLNKKNYEYREDIDSADGYHFEYDKQKSTAFCRVIKDEINYMQAPAISDITLLMSKFYLGLSENK